MNSIGFVCFATPTLYEPVEQEGADEQNSTRCGYSDHYSLPRSSGKERGGFRTGRRGGIGRGCICATGVDPEMSQPMSAFVTSLPMILTGKLNYPVGRLEQPQNPLLVASLPVR
jgi:hypothetical protein